MKRIQFKVILIAFFAVAGLVSCTDLEIEETDSIITEGFQGLADPSSTVDELYNRLTGQYGNQSNWFALQEVTTDAAIIPTRGTDWGDNGEWRNLHNHGWNSEHPQIGTIWNDFNANQLIASQVLDSRSSPTAQNVADASFVRALSMWLILDNFGQIPFRDTSLPSSSLPEVLSGQAAFDFIMADLDQAISGFSSLPAGQGAEATFRASKEAAKYLKAKILLNKHVYLGGTPDSGDMSQVISLVDDITAQGYALETMNYFQIFRDGADTETIWSLKSATGNRIFNGLHYNNTSLQGGGWNGFSTLAEYYDLFEGDADFNRVEVDQTPLDGQEDRRGGVPPMGTPFTGVPGTVDDGNGFENGSNVGFGFLINQQYALDGTPLQDRAGAPLTFKRDFRDGSGAESFINNDETTGIRYMKYNPRYDEGQSSHEIVFRYADAHLMKAEALMRSGGDPTALVNELRAVRNAAAVLGSVGETELLAERGRELNAELWRRNDMIRFGQFTRDWLFKESPAIGNPEKQLFPIPAAQLLANPTLVQNPGY